MQFPTPFLLAICLAQVSGGAQERPKLQVTRIRLKYARPSVLKDRLLYIRPEWWNPKERPPYSIEGNDQRELPAGIQSLTAYDVDNTLIVRGDRDAVERFRQEIDMYDLPAVSVRVRLLSHPILRDRTPKPNVEADLFRADKRQEFRVDEDFATAAVLGPNGFGEPEPDFANPTLIDTYLLVVVHVEESGRVSLLATMAYRDSVKQFRCVSRRLLSVKLNSPQRVLFRIDDKQHPVKQYAVSLTVINVERPKQDERSEQNGMGER